MTTYDESLHPRGQAANAGQFRSKENDAPTSVLAQPRSSEKHLAAAAAPIDAAELLEMLDQPERYASTDVSWLPITDRVYREIDGAPSQRINQDRPAFTDTGERDFRTALDRLDDVWARTHTIDERADALIADMRASGALGSGGGAALEAYARAITLNESGGYIDEEQVNYLLDRIEEGHLDYRVSARAFGYHPEQYVADLATAARAAAYRAEHEEDERTRIAAKERHATMLMLAEDAAGRLDRGWSSRERDIDRLEHLMINAGGTEVPDGDSARHELIIESRRRAYMDALTLVRFAGEEV
ncbi:MAG: hypothetical protein J0J04_08530 [Microbacterium sp.]|uniref:hypothetical protein n=1 Tax=Microbacterium sp. TaxID=51671 RepID=UPI001ACA6FD6|nr:hypothetical protein [Microbacterium sp.]MBN9214822.1 hypothetical protein [Microbacterium sp.]